MGVLVFASGNILVPTKIKYLDEWVPNQCILRGNVVSVT